MPTIESKSRFLRTEAYSSYHWLAIEWAFKNAAGDIPRRLKPYYEDSRRKIERRCTRIRAEIARRRRSLARDDEEVPFGRRFYSLATRAPDKAFPTDHETAKAALKPIADNWDKEWVPFTLPPKTKIRFMMLQELETEAGSRAYDGLPKERLREWLRARLINRGVPERMVDMYTAIKACNDFERSRMFMSEEDELTAGARYFRMTLEAISSKQNRVPEGFLAYVMALFKVAWLIEFRRLDPHLFEIGALQEVQVEDLEAEITRAINYVPWQTRALEELSKKKGRTRDD